MCTTCVPKRVLLCMLAFALACTLNPIVPSYAAEPNQSTPAQAANAATSASASSSAQAVSSAASVVSSAASSASQAAADQADGTTSADTAQPTNSANVEQTGATEAADPNITLNATDAPVEIISGQVALATSNEASALIQQNGLTFVATADGTATMIGWGGAAPKGELHVPAQVNGLPVTTIDFLAAASLAFEDLQMSDAARWLAESDAVAAAMQAPDVTRLTIPASVTSINTASFAAFPGLASIQVAADNTTYSSYNGMLFDEQLSYLHLVPEAMEGVAVLPASLAAVPACVITRCTKLFGLDIPTGGAADAAFATRNGILYERNLSPSGTPDGTLTLLAAPMGIGASAMIDASCTSIAEGAFWGNTALQTIVVKGTVDVIAAGSIALPTVEAEDNARINAPMPLSEDGDRWASLPAFGEEVPRNAVVALNVPEVDRAFAKGPWEAAGFTHFADPATPGDTAHVDGFAFTLLDDFTLSVAYEGEAQGDITIPESAQIGDVAYGVSTIADAAFEGQANLQAITIPEGVGSIGGRAFADCTSLASISVPGSVTTIGKSAFAGCAALTEITLCEGVAAIEDGAFANTAIASIALPKTVRTLGSAIFTDCVNLTSVLVLGTPTDISATALGNATGVKVYVPASENGSIWPQLPASGNTACEYGASLPEDPITMTVGDEIYLPNYEGVSLHVSGDITTSYTYKGYPIYVETDGTVKAKMAGTAPVNVMLYLGPTLLAKATATVMVQAAAEEDREGAHKEISDYEQEQIIFENTETDMMQSISDDDMSNVSVSPLGLTPTVTAVVNSLSYVQMALSARASSTVKFPVSDSAVGDRGNIIIMSKTTLQRTYVCNDGSEWKGPDTYSAGKMTPAISMDWFKFSSTQFAEPSGDGYNLMLFGIHPTKDGNPSIASYWRKNSSTMIKSVWASYHSDSAAFDDTFIRSQSGYGKYTPPKASSGHFPTTTYLYINGYGDRTVTFNANQGLFSSTLSNTSSVLVHPNESKTAPVPVREGYTFDGWYTKATGGNWVVNGGGVISATDKDTILADQTLYAHWTPINYTITWNPNGGKWSDGTTGNKTTSVAYGSTPTAPGTPTKANTAQYTYGSCVWSPKIVAVTGATTYTATYTSTVKKHTITWKAGGGKWSDGTTDDKTTTVAYGSTPTAPDTPSKANTTQFTYGPCVWDPAITSVTGAKTYTATYTETNNVYTVTLSNNNATTDGTSVLYLKYNVGWFSDSACAKAISSITTPKRTGYVFGGYTDVTGTSSTTSATTSTNAVSGDITASKTAFAANTSRDPIWNIINYTISYDYNGGSVSSANKNSYTIETDTFQLNNPTKGGYTHNSWTVSGNSNITGGGVDISGTTAKVKTGTYGNLTFTAGYYANTYNITYDLKGGSISREKTQYKTDDADFNLVNPTRLGYTFAGWTVTGASGTGVKTSGVTTTVQKETYGDLSCVASWTPNTYTVTFDKNVGDSGDKVEPMPYAPEPFSFAIKFSEKDLTTPNDTVIIPNVIPKRTGYTFDGWKVEGQGIANNTTDYDATRIYMPGDTYRHPFDRDVTLFAQWTENEGYRVNFYKFTEDGAEDRIEFTPDYANLKYEDKFQLPGRGNVPDNDKVSGYYLYGWSWSREAGADGSAKLTTFVIPASATLDDRVSIRDILTAIGNGTPEEPEGREVNLYAVWQMVYSVSAPTSSEATGIVLDASEVAVYRPADITFTNTTPCEVAVGAYSEYDKGIFEGVFPNTRVRDVDFSFVEAGADADSTKYFQLNGDAFDDETWRRRLTRLSQGSASAPSTLDAVLSFDFNRNSVNISHELQEDANGILMNGKHWERPIARITWLFSPDEASALTYTLLPSMPASGSAPGHGEVDLASDALPFVKPSD